MIGMFFVVYLSFPEVENAPKGSRILCPSLIKDDALRRPTLHFHRSDGAHRGEDATLPVKRRQTVAASRW